MTKIALTGPGIPSSLPINRPSLSCFLKESLERICAAIQSIFTQLGKFFSFFTTPIQNFFRTRSLSSASTPSVLSPAEAPTALIPSNGEDLPTRRVHWAPGNPEVFLYSVPSSTQSTADSSLVSQPKSLEQIAEQTHVSISAYITTSIMLTYYKSRQINPAGYSTFKQLFEEHVVGEFEKGQYDYPMRLEFLKAFDKVQKDLQSYFLRNPWNSLPPREKELYREAYAFAKKGLGGESFRIFCPVLLPPQFSPSKDLDIYPLERRQEQNRVFGNMENDLHATQRALIEAFIQFNLRTPLGCHSLTYVHAPTRPWRNAFLKDVLKIDALVLREAIERELGGPLTREESREVLTELDEIEVSHRIYTNFSKCRKELKRKPLVIFDVAVYPEEEALPSPLHAKETQQRARLIESIFKIPSMTWVLMDTTKNPMVRMAQIQQGKLEIFDASSLAELRRKDPDLDQALKKEI